MASIAASGWLGATPLRHAEILEKALGQVNQANEEIKRFRILNEFARFNTVVKPCQRAIIIRAARSASERSRPQK
jgi:hypothetical protein